MDRQGVLVDFFVSTGKLQFGVGSRYTLTRFLRMARID